MPDINPNIDTITEEERDIKRSELFAALNLDKIVLEDPRMFNLAEYLNDKENGLVQHCVNMFKEGEEFNFKDLPYGSSACILLLTNDNFPYFVILGKRDVDGELYLTGNTLYEEREEIRRSTMDNLNSIFRGEELQTGFGLIGRVVGGAIVEKKFDRKRRVITINMMLKEFQERTIKVLGRQFRSGESILAEAKRKDQDNI